MFGAYCDIFYDLISITPSSDTLDTCVSLDDDTIKIFCEDNTDLQNEN